jgi:Flp pilus assembly protein TadB
MPERSGQRPTRAKQAAQRRTRQTNAAPPRNTRSAGIRERLKRDPFLFLLCLGALAFMTWAFALTWWVTGGVVPLALALACVAPAFFLFYLRDA